VQREAWLSALERQSQQEHLGGTIGGFCVPIDVCWIMKDQLRRITVRIEKKNEDVT